MSMDDSENRPPVPPRLIPPAPPPPELLRPNVPHVPLTPVMDFLQRRLETLEKELSVERERAIAAQGLLQQQDALRAQVEQQLKAMSDSMRREKAERDSEETKQHARGRIDVLEKRLDDMHQSWVTLLKEAVSQRESSHSAVTATQDGIAREQAGLKQEITALLGAIEAMGRQMAEWRVETKPVADAAPSLRNFEAQVAQRLDHFAAELRDRVAAMERRQTLELEKQEERFHAVVREKASLQRELEERDHLIRQESIKEKLHREQQIGEQFAELSRRLDDMRREAEQGRAALGKILERVTATPEARDKVIESLESEKAELVKALKDRQASLDAHLQQRREVEHTLGESLLQANKEIDHLQAEAQRFHRTVSDLELGRERLADELKSARALAEQREERRRALEDERDAIAKTLMSESAKARDSHEAWAARVSELQSQLAAELEAKSREQTSNAELRAQLATLTEHLARAIQERDAAKGTGGWEKEKADLLRRLDEKEQMITMLNATFRKFLK